MVAATVLVVGILGVLSLLDGSNAATTSTKAREGATNLAREVVEASRGVDYDSLDSTHLLAALQAQPQLADAAARSGWQVVRRNRTYTIKVTACAVDDGSADGYGSHAGSVPFCSDSTSTGTADANPDDYRRVTVDVSWRVAGKSGKVRQEATINNPGSAYASAVRTLTPNGMSLPYTVTSPSVTSITFTVQTSGIPSVVRWYQDNLYHGDATGSYTTYSFTWDISNVTDGTYVIGAQAFDADDESGATKAVTVTLNRYQPSTPTGFVGGRNGLVGLEFEWNPNAERDITGYRVYQMLGSSPNTATDTVVCTTSTADTNPTTCINATVPVGTAKYYVVALAPARAPATGTELSAPPTAANTLVVDNSNIAPNPPQNVTATRQDGMVMLSWQAPVDPAAGETGDTLRYFRIYRDGIAYANRVDTSGSGTATSWVDFNPGDQTHTYYVTSVDSHLAESVKAPLLGVTG
jgi:Tfp pilus assembly protein PilV